MARHKAPEPSQRMLRVGEELRHIISETLREGGFDDPVLFEQASTVTVSQVSVSPDLKYATAYVMSLGGLNMDEILPAAPRRYKKSPCDISKIKNAQDLHSDI